MLKDVRHCLEEGQAAGVPFPRAPAFAREVLGAAQSAEVTETRTSPV